MAQSDTSEKARAVYFQRLAGMTPAERLRIGASLWEAAHSLQRAAVRRRIPEANDTEIAFEIAVARIGPDLARRIWRKV